MSVIATVATRAPEEGERVADPGEQRHDQDERETARHDQPPHRVEPHRAQRVDFLRDLHRSDLRGETSTRSAGHHDRGNQRPELTEVSDDDELGNIRHGAEAAQLRDAQKPDDDADQQVGRTRHRQSVRADLLDQPRQRSPVDRAW